MIKKNLWFGVNYVIVSFYVYAYKLRNNIKPILFITNEIKITCTQNNLLRFTFTSLLFSKSLTFVDLKTIRGLIFNLQFLDKRKWVIFICSKGFLRIGIIDLVFFMLNI